MKTLELEKMIVERCKEDFPEVDIVMAAYMIMVFREIGAVDPWGLRDIIWRHKNARDRIGDPTHAG